MNHDELVELLAAESSRFVATVVALDVDVWDGPGLGDWTLRELVGHTMRAFSTIDHFLDHPRDDAAVGSASEYYRIALGTRPDVHATVAERGRQAGRDLGPDPVAAVVDQVSGTLGRLGSTSGEEVGTTVVGGMRLSNYLETRIVELVVHHSDVRAAVGAPPGDLGPAGALVAATIFASATSADQLRVVRAILGRDDLPAGFNVWP